MSDWADEYGLTFPVLADVDWEVDSRWNIDGAEPTHTLLGPGLQVLMVDERITTADIEAAIP